MLNEQGISTDLENVQIIKEQKAPENKAAMKSLLDISILYLLYEARLRKDVCRYTQPLQRLLSI